MIFGRFILRPDNKSIFPLGFEALVLDEDLPEKSLKLIPWARESGELVLLVHNWTVEDGLASASIAGMEVLLRDQVTEVSPDTLVIAEEFSEPGPFEISAPFAFSDTTRFVDREFGT